MSAVKLSWQAVVALALSAIAMTMPAMTSAEVEALANPTATMDYPYLGTRGLIFALIAIAALASMARTIPPIAEAAILFVGAHGAAWLILGGIAGFEGRRLRRTSSPWRPLGCLPGAA